ncbi:sigma-70 family RNA polymerase sigma factor [Pedobacter cryotolerans]|uniref:Sigma-70 family RNA polymerase sigma factor n=1 Tax=Pedobacter cryotolerans TaxID=2571270 RepID=A0A4U1C8X7_9SPHI|nr:sigma-70 family RNA polymerase sigma factor [Pedobacter cryotolerans]TKC00033.1 sigma-70 family RNA polymerase sigma factor [Pedobacter cryotolerans]
MSGYKTLSDDELVALLREGNHLAYSEIYNRFFYLMFVFAYKKLSDEELAKDFVQELFTKLWVKKETILENGNIAQYLYISLRSRIFDFFAHQKVQTKYIDSLKDFASTNIVEYTDHLIREKQLLEYIEVQIKSLPKKMREVFEMSRKQYLSNKEIAEELGTTESNVSHHINNAVKILRTKLGLIIAFLPL